MKEGMRVEGREWQAEVTHSIVHIRVDLRWSSREVSKHCESGAVLGKRYKFMSHLSLAVNDSS